MIKIQKDELFSILTGSVSVVVNKAFLKAFAREGIKITNDQLLVMTCLWTKDKVTQQALSNQTLKNKPTMTRLIDKLEANSLVTRVSHPGDRRSNMIYLTESGIALELKVTEIVEKLLDNITEEEFELFRIVFRKMMSNLC